jgi:hypothetical protein
MVHANNLRVPRDLSAIIIICEKPAIKSVRYSSHVDFDPHFMRHSFFLPAVVDVMFQKQLLPILPNLIERGMIAPRDRKGQ